MQTFNLYCCFFFGVTSDDAQMQIFCLTFCWKFKAKINLFSLKLWKAFWCWCYLFILILFSNNFQWFCLLFYFCVRCEHINFVITLIVSPFSTDETVNILNLLCRKMHQQNVVVRQYLYKQNNVDSTFETTN